jgi:hypothetical protein
MKNLVFLFICIGSLGCASSRLSRTPQSIEQRAHPLEMRGYFVMGGVPSISLYNPESGHSAWKKEGESFQGYLVYAIDEERGRAILKKDEQLSEIWLASSRILEEESDEKKFQLPTDINELLKKGYAWSELEEKVPGSVMMYYGSVLRIKAIPVNQDYFLYQEEDENGYVDVAQLVKWSRGVQSQAAQLLEIAPDLKIEDIGKYSDFSVVDGQDEKFYVLLKDHSGRIDFYRSP